MSEPISPQQPFQPEATPVRGGCGKAALFGCGGLFILLLIAGIVSIVKVKEITAWGFGVMEEQVMARLPAETTDEEARRIRDGFAAVVEAVQEDRVEPNALERLQPVILRFADPNKSPRSEDVQLLIELLETAAGTAPESPAPDRPGSDSIPATPDSAAAVPETSG